MNKLTRNKAAEILGVSAQTISNYVKEGLLGGYKDEKGCFYVNGDDVERYAKKYKFIAVSEEMLDNKLSALKAEREKASSELAALRRKMLDYGHGFQSLAPDITEMITALYNVVFVPDLRQREYNILTAFLKGANLHELSEEYHISPERVRQIIVKACRRFSKRADEIKHNVIYNEQLERNVKELELSLKGLEERYNAYREAHEDNPVLNVARPPEILQTRISDCDLPVRIIKCMNFGADVFTIGEMLTKFSSLHQIDKEVRNLGRKSLSQIEDFLWGLGLFFKEEDESEEHFYIRLNESLNSKKNEY